MLAKISILLLITAVASADTEYLSKWDNECDNGMVYVGGVCRDVILYNDNMEFGDKNAKNIVKTRPNCPNNMIAYETRDGSIMCRLLASEQVRAESVPQNIVTVKPNCPEGQEWVNGKCVDVWPNNVVTMPPNCPPGQQWINGKCVDVWPKNIVTVPPNCPPGQVWIGGQCRDVWRSNTPVYCPNGLIYNGKCFTGHDILAKIINNLKSIAKPIQDDIVMDAEVFDGMGAEYLDIENRRVVNVPNHCPVGFRPDANGVCRPIF